MAVRQTITMMLPKHFNGKTFANRPEGVITLIHHDRDHVDHSIDVQVDNAQAQWMVSNVAKIAYNIRNTAKNSKKQSPQWTIKQEDTSSLCRFWVETFKKINLAECQRVYKLDSDQDHLSLNNLIVK